KSLQSIKEYKSNLY
ncbi:hypothetical protein VCNHCC008D_002227B, partial [Vibrio cholerae O1 str. NHCC-008D]